ncbi:DnaJ protein, putative [Plasmodium gallinaceum]|uniref:DnaJ protein, putative n=1 Tax=Plasmodium gallinaceum TaxID=5849 RepID=A0A1J1GLX4_PLAGA|nr:DnaJ protein, putative [Plasmodium gallinaceum]CRG93385.1 DnaJ protein, putative [Plasmodium gallinaceum]
MSSWGFFNEYLNWFNNSSDDKNEKIKKNDSIQKDGNRIKCVKKYNPEEKKNKDDKQNNSTKNEISKGTESSKYEDKKNKDNNFFNNLNISNWIPNYDTHIYNDYKKGYYLDKEAKEVLSKKTSKKSNMIKIGADNTHTNEFSSSDTSNICVDTTYYDILNISPNAKLSEIKNSYYKLALKYHPDKNSNDPEAKLKFQKINEAYQVLGDEERRMKYNKYGLNATKDMILIDPSIFFMMLFSSEELSDYIGTLRIAFFVQLAFEGNMSIEDVRSSNEVMMSEMEVEQKKREVELALLLRTRLQPYVDGDNMWNEKMEKEIKGLLDSSFSSSILESIGWTYENVSTSYIAEVTTLWGVGATVANIQAASRTIGNTFCAAKSMINTVVTIKDFSLNSEKMNSIKEKKENHKNFNNSSNNNDHNNSEGNNIDNSNNNISNDNIPLIDKEENKALGIIIKNVLTLVLWDIESTVRQAADKVIRDEGVDLETRLKRAEGMKILGKLMQKWSKIKKNINEVNDIDATKLLETAIIKASKMANEEGDDTGKKENEKKNTYKYEYTDEEKNNER